MSGWINSAKNDGFTCKCYVPKKTGTPDSFDWNHEKCQARFNRCFVPRNNVFLEVDADTDLAANSENEEGVSEDGDCGDVICNSETCTAQTCSDSALEDAMKASGP